MNKNNMIPHVMTTEVATGIPPKTGITNETLLSS
jgi:hypothetical protein